MSLGTAITSHREQRDKMLRPDTPQGRYAGFFSPVRTPQLRLFCFPHAGAGATAFASWAKFFPENVQLCPVQLPGRENRLGESPFDRMGPLMDSIMESLLQYCNCEFALFGHSMGALIAFEFARRLKLENKSPKHMFVSACAAPHLPPSRPLLHCLQEEEFIQEVSSRYDGIPDEILNNAEAMQIFMPLLRSDISMFETYDYLPGKLLDCPVTCLGGLMDSTVERHELEAWQAHTSQQFSMHWVAGKHFYLQENAHQVIQILFTQLHRYAGPG